MGCGVCRMISSISQRICRIEMCEGCKVLEVEVRRLRAQNERLMVDRKRVHDALRVRVKEIAKLKGEEDGKEG